MRFLKTKLRSKGQPATTKFCSNTENLVHNEIGTESKEEKILLLYHGQGVKAFVYSVTPKNTNHLCMNQFK